MRSVAYAVLVGLLGAAFLHIVIVLSLPRLTGRDAYTQVQSFGELNRFIPLADAASRAAPLANDDPDIKAAVCAFSLDEFPVRLFARGDVPFWSLAIFDSASNEVFSMNDRTAVNGMLDVLVATPIQLTAIRKALPEDLSQSILVEMPDDEGYAVLRTFIPSQSQEPAGRTFLSESACEDFDGR
ncbi:MAG: DUF1254 domain-containing protein [Shinella sp.]|nr:DUF1254 domain-containing protein [Shinella sp.]